MTIIETSPPESPVRSPPESPVRSAPESSAQGSVDSSAGSVGDWPRPSQLVLIGRAMRLICPRCGVGKLYNGLLSMPERCSVCRLPLRREPGFYLGSIYVNYGWTVVISTVAWIVFRFGYGIPSNRLLWGFVPFVVIFPMLFFRHARSLWLLLDVTFDGSNWRRGDAGDDEAVNETVNTAGANNVGTTTAERSKSVPVIGIVGGVASGKSHLAREFAKRWPAVVIDGDVAGHTVLKIPEIRAQVVAAFGTGILDDSGEIVRRELAGLVFGDSEEKRAALRTLEAIVHPEISKLLRQEIAAARSNSANRVVFLDAALLLDAGWNSLCDGVVFVDTPLSVRMQRASARGWKPGQFESRELNQMPLSQKRAKSGLILDGTRTADELLTELYDFVGAISLRPTS